MLAWNFCIFYRFRDIARTKFYEFAPKRHLLTKWTKRSTVFLLSLIDFKFLVQYCIWRDSVSFINQPFSMSLSAILNFFPKITFWVIFQTFLGVRLSNFQEDSLNYCLSVMSARRSCIFYRFRDIARTNSWICVTTPPVVKMTLLALKITSLIRSVSNSTIWCTFVSPFYPWILGSLGAFCRPFWFVLAKITYLAVSRELIGVGISNFACRFLGTFPIGNVGMPFLYSLPFSKYFENNISKIYKSSLN